LVEWIISQDTRGVAPRPSQVKEMANILLQEGSRSGQQAVGKNWVTEFIKRHDEIKSRFARRYNFQRALCKNPKLIRQWFDRLKEICMQYGISTEDIYNFDETGFAMGLIATTKVVTRSNMPGRPHLIQPGQREWVTTIECINTRGWSLPTCIIFKGRVYIEGWFEEINLPSSWRIEISANGWTTDEIGLQWLQEVFIPATTPWTVGKY
jgi:hypothetical protein